MRGTTPAWVVVAASLLGCGSDSSDGIGRFPQLHGVSKDEGHHGSGFANAMWAAYVTTM